MHLSDFRRLRGLFGISVAWACMWVPLGCLVSIADALIRGRAISVSSLAGDVGPLAGIGAISGLLFGVVLAAAERGKSFERLSHARIVTWAIAAGLVIPGGYAIANGFSGAILGFIGYGAVNAVAAATTLSVARRARELSSPTASTELPRDSA